MLAVDDWLPEEAERVIGRHLDAGDLAGVSAILCAGDSLALGALSALAARGIACPEEISVAGIDDLPIAGLLKPRLTTIHIPSRELGSMAIDMMSDQSLHRNGIARRVELACRLVIRDSTGSFPLPG